MSINDKRYDKWHFHKYNSLHFLDVIVTYKTIYISISICSDQNLCNYIHEIFQGVYLLLM